MRAKSKKTEAIYVERRRLVERLLVERPLCETCIPYATLDDVRPVQRESIDIHELVTRGRGGSILDESNLLAVCRFPCHSRLTGDTLEAEFCGLVLPSWANAEVAQEALIRRTDLSGGIVPQDPPTWWDETKRDRWLSRFHKTT